MEKLRKGQRIVNWMHDNDKIADQYPHLQAVVADFTRMDETRVSFRCISKTTTKTSRSC